MTKRSFDNPNNEFVRKNEQIRISKVLLICDNENMGVVPTNFALNLAKSKKLDLVEISPNSRPPVCKIMDFGKFQFDKKIKEKKRKKQSKKSQIKEIRLSPTIGSNDLDTKLKSSIKFLSQGHKVSVKLEFKRRQLLHGDLGFDVINDFVEKLKEYATVVRDPKKDGRNIFCLLEPKNDE